MADAMKFDVIEGPFMAPTSKPRVFKKVSLMVCMEPKRIKGFFVLGHSPKELSAMEIQVISSSVLSS